MKIKVWRTLSLVLGMLLATYAAASTFTVRPSAYFSSGGGVPYSNPPYAYDGNFTTASIGFEREAVKGFILSYETWWGFPSAPPGATQMQLNVSSAYSSTRGGYAYLWYSLDGGNTFTQVYAEEGQVRGQETNVIPLSESQDLTKVRVEVRCMAGSDGTFQSASEQWVYEIWISGTE